jgi:magnesium chelatase accessory protein
MSAPDWQREGRDWPNAGASRFVAAGGVRWHVQVMGEGPVALLLHGTGAATHSWRDLAPLLAGHFTVVAPDLPGHGFTGTMRRPTPTGVAEAVSALVATLELPPSLIIGHSAGAAVALTMAQTKAAAPKAIVGLAGALLPFPGMAGALFPAMARMLFVNPFVPELLAMRARLPGETASFLRRATGSRIDQRGVGFYERLLKTSAHCGGALALMANWDLEPLNAAMPGLQLPVLLVHGEQDSTIPPATSSTVAARLPDATTHFVPRLGHLAHEEAPDVHAGLILDFARRSGIMVP